MKFSGNSVAFLGFQEVYLALSSLFEVFELVVSGSVSVVLMST